MRKIFSLSLSIVVISAFIYGFIGNEDPTQRSQNNTATGNYPIVVNGPALNGPLSNLSESFEGATFPPAGWTKITPTGGAGYNRQTAGTSPVPGFNGGTMSVPVGGGTALGFCNYLTGTAGGSGSGLSDQWLITPQITNVQPNDSLSFWIWKFGNYKENMIIRISTTTPSVAGMTIRIDSISFLAADSGWVQKKYKIGSLVPTGSNVYIGFREWVLSADVDGASIGLDLVQVTATATGIGNNGNDLPKSYSVSQNYPNPFNPTTKINFALPQSGLVTVKVYDVVGKEVATLVNEVKNVGTYSVDFNAANLTSGIYFYKVSVNGFSEVKKMMLIK